MSDRFGCSPALQREADALVHASSLRFDKPRRSTMSGPDRVSGRRSLPRRLERRSVRSGPPLLRFRVPSTCASRAALSGAASHRTVPLRRSPSRDAAGGRSSAPRSRPCGFSFARLASTVRVTLVTHSPSRFTPARAGHAPRSLFRAAFRYLRWSPGTTGPDRVIFGPATFMGLFSPFAVFPARAGPGVCDRAAPWFHWCRRAAPSPPFIPTCRYRDAFRTPLIFTAAVAPRTLATPSHSERAKNM